MADISVSTTQSVIEVTETSGISVTVPTGQTIDVAVPNSSVNVTNTTDNITILTGGTLNINSSGVITSVNGNTGPIVVLDTDDISQGTTNLYYSTALANADFDTRLATKTTDNLTQGSTNRYFSQALARQSLSAGTGISYDNITGVITNTSINTDTTYTIDATSTTGGANLNLTGSDATTDTVKFASGTNTTVSRTDANTITIASTDTNTTYTQNISSTTGGANLNLVGSDSTTDTVKFASGTGVTVAYTDANTATVSIGQSVATTDSVTFGSVNLDSLAALDTATLTTSATTADQVLDSFAAVTYRTAKYLISVSSGSSYQSLEILVVHNGTTASQTTYADISTGSALATFSVDINSGNVRLLTTPINAVTAYKLTKTTIVV